MTIAVLKRQVLEEDVVGIDYDGSTHADVQCIFTTAELVVEDDGLVTILTNEVEVRLGGRHVDMLLVFAVLDEDEPGFGTSGRSSVDGSLNSLVVA